MNSTDNRPTPSLTPLTQVRQHPDLIAAEADGEVLMMDVESGNYFGLNAVASFVWHQLEAPRTVADVCAVIQSEFEVDEEQCMTDLLAHLQAMIADGLVVVVPFEAQVTTTDS